MPATDIDFEREFEELVRDLRALPTAAPQQVREHVRALGEPAQPRTVHDLLDVGRADFLFALAHKYQVDGQLPPCAPDGVNRRQKRSLGSLGIYGNAACQRFAESRFVHQSGSERG